MTTPFTSIPASGRPTLIEPSVASDDAFGRGLAAGSARFGAALTPVFGLLPGDVLAPAPWLSATAIKAAPSASDSRRPSEAMTRPLSPRFCTAQENGRFRRLMQSATNAGTRL